MARTCPMNRKKNSRNMMVSVQQLKTTGSKGREWFLKEIERENRNRSSELGTVEEKKRMKHSVIENTCLHKRISQNVRASVVVASIILLNRNNAMYTQHKWNPVPKKFILFISSVFNCNKKLHTFFKYCVLETEIRSLHYRVFAWLFLRQKSDTCLWLSGADFGWE